MDFLTERVQLQKKKHLEKDKTEKKLEQLLSTLPTGKGEETLHFT